MYMDLIYEASSDKLIPASASLSDVFEKVFLISVEVGWTKKTIERRNIS